MTVPRISDFGAHPRRNLRLGLAALGATLLASPCLAQTPVPAPGVDSTLPVRPDSIRRDSVPSDGTLADTTGRDTTRADTARRDTTRADTTRRDTTRADTTRADTTRGVTGRAPADTGSAAPQPPADSTLASACKGLGTASPDLLIVTFRPATTAEERAAVAQAVGGAVAGPSEYAAPGAWYLKVPGASYDPSVADRLILLSPVVEVGNTRCSS